MAEVRKGGGAVNYRAIVFNTGTGYFARAKNEYGSKPEYIGQVHLVCGGDPICGRMPPRTARYQFCSNGVSLEMVECDKCKQVLARALIQHGNDILASIKPKQKRTQRATP